MQPALVQMRTVQQRSATTALLRRGLGEIALVQKKNPTMMSSQTWFSIYIRTKCVMKKKCKLCINGAGARAHTDKHSHICHKFRKHFIDHEIKKMRSSINAQLNQCARSTTNADSEIMCLVRFSAYLSVGRSVAILKDLLLGLTVIGMPVYWLVCISRGHNFAVRKTQETKGNIV